MYKTRLIKHLMVFLSFSNACYAQSLTRFEYTFGKLGTICKVIFYAQDSVTAQSAIHDVLLKIDTLNGILSDYDENSEIRKLCALYAVNQPVQVSKTLYDMIKKSIYFSKLTQGAFDITVGNYVLLWRRARRQKVFPTQKQLAQAKATVGYQKIKLVLQSQAIIFKAKDIRLDVGAIGKGYIADEILKLLQTKFGITVALADLGGDIALGDAPPEKTGWLIQVKDKELLLKNCAIATSGDSFQFVEFDGKRYSHILNPKTGIGLTDAPQVTVIAPDGTAADALASAMSVLGQEFITVDNSHQEDKRLKKLIQKLTKELGYLQVIFHEK